MNRSHWTARSCLSLLLALSLCLLPACVFEAGVGDSTESKVQKKLQGFWVTQTEMNLNLFKAAANEDGKSYAVELFMCKGTLEEPGTPQLRVKGEAWLWKIEGERFVTVKVLSIKATSESKPAKPYMIFKLSAAEDSLELTPLDNKFRDFQDAKTRDDMERAVKENMQNSSAYATPIKCKRTTADAAKKVIDLFERE